VRLLIYSFLTFEELLYIISKISKSERKLLTSESKILDQERYLILRIPESRHDKEMFKYACKVSSLIYIKMFKWRELINEEEEYFLSYVFSEFK
jgi:hypothetical protein